MQRLPYGIYQIEIKQSGFASVSESVEIHSSIPIRYAIQLNLPSVNESVTVSAANTLIDPDQAGSVNQVGSDLIQTRVSSVPGRSLQDLVNSQPGWLYEGNAVLHPRGSEYQTQFVVDGIPLTDNRSPSFGPEIEADEVQSLSIYTAGIPAEYGRKMGGVVEVNTIQDSQAGFHGEVVLSGGSYDSAGAFAKGQYAWGKNTFGGSASGSMTDHYLNPVVPQNYSNTGTLGDFSVNYERELTPNDRVRFIVRHELSRYDIPNEQVQQAAGQRQTADNFETMGIASYQHTFSSQAVADFRAMVRDNANDFNSNPEFNSHRSLSAQLVSRRIFQRDRDHRPWPERMEVWSRVGQYLSERKLQLLHYRSKPIRSGDASNLQLHRQSPRPRTIRIHAGSDPPGKLDDQRRASLGPLSTPVQPASRWIRASRFRVISLPPTCSCISPMTGFFRPRPSENILLSSSTAIESLDPANFLRLPVEPSEGNYYEAGLTKVFVGKIRLDANYFRRLVDNYADDDQIDNTTSQLSHRISQIHHLWRGSKTRSSRLARLLRFSELFLHRRQCLVSGDRRSLLGRRCHLLRPPNSSAISRIRRISATPFAGAFATRSRRASGSRAEFNTTLDCPSSSMATRPRCSPNTASRF